MLGCGPSILIHFVERIVTIPFCRQDQRSKTHESTSGFRRAWKKRGDSYGKAVLKHLHRIKQHLLDDGPKKKEKRRSWLRFVKDLADFVASNRRKAAPNS